MLAKNSQDVENFLVFGVVNLYRYTNWEGEIQLRKFVPLHLRWGKTEYHKEDQWLLEVYDVEKKALRTYALKDIHPR